MATPTPASDLLKASFKAVEPRANEVVDRFYEKLFTTAPGVRSLFPKDMGAQKRHLLAALSLVVKDSHRLEVLAAPLREMGKRHVAYGAKPEHYPVVRDTLLATLAEFAGSLWTGPMAAAWEGAINSVAGVMLAGAAEGADAPEAKRRAA